MKSISSLLLILAPLLAFAQTIPSNTLTASFVPGSADEHELVRLTKLMSSASETGNADAYREYIDDNFMLTYSACNPSLYGKFINKKQVIDKWAGRKDPADSLSTSTPNILLIQLSGTTGIVHSTITDSFIDNGKPVNVITWCSDVWVKRKNQWYWLSSHETLPVE